MARGWESKSVEQQQEEAKSRGPTRRPLSPRQIADEQQRQSLRLSRARIEQQLERATSPRHREMLEAALKDLDERLAKTARDH